MTREHPITPPPELFKQWFKQWEDDILNERDSVDHVLDRAWRNGFQAGADQELEACCHLLRQQGFDVVEDLRAARRPKPPSLKERALEEVGVFEGMGTCNIDIIRHALEALPDG